MVFLRLTLNIFDVFSSVSIADFEQANLSWKGLFTTLSKTTFEKIATTTYNYFFVKKLNHRCLKRSYIQSWSNLNETCETLLHQLSPYSLGGDDSIHKKNMKQI